MAKFCTNCQKEKVIELNVNNRKVYYCPQCHIESERFLTRESDIAVLEADGQKMHVTVGAIIKSNERILFLDRRSFPFGFDFPAGHLEYGEKPETAIIREVREETGLTVIKSRLILEKKLENECRYGADHHLWLLYECQVDDYEGFANSESNGLFWMTRSEALKKNLVQSCRQLLNLGINKTVTSNTNTIFPLIAEKADSSYEEQRERQQELLFHISRSLFKLDSVDRVLKIAVSEAIKALDSFSVSIFLFDQSQNKLISKAYIRNDGKESPTSFSEFKLGEGVAGLCAQIRQPLIIEDVSKSKIYIGKIIDHGGIACIPMVASDKLIGVLSVSFADKKIFTESEIHFLSILGSMASIAIENSTLHGRLQHKTNNLAKLFGVTFKPGEQSTNQIQEIIDSIPPLFESELCHLWMVNHKKNQLETTATSENNPSILRKVLPISLEKKCITQEVFKTGVPIIINNADRGRLLIPRYQKLFSIKSQISVPIAIGNVPVGVLHIVNKNDNNFTEDDLKLALIVASRIGTKIENISLLTKATIESETLKNIINNVNEGIIAINLQSNRIRIWNNYCEEIFNLSSNEAIGQNINVLRKIGFREILNELRDILKTKEIRNRYFEEIINTDLGETTLSINLALTSDKKNGNNLILVIRNISKEKALMRAKNDLISTATHELRTPLTATKGYLSMLINGDAGPIDGKVRKYSEKALGSTNRLVDLVEDLLSALRIEEGKINLDLQNINLNSIIEDAVESFKNKSGEKNISIGFAKTNSTIFAYADPQKTRQVIDNLIDNALKYTREKGIVKISLENRRRDVLIRVSDNGVGIPESSLSNVFDRFVRIENPLSIKAGGTGLGLYIVKNMVEKQGGKVWAKSKIRQGSDFYFTLPNSNFIKNS